MANWNDIMEAYESNDCESLGEYAFAHMNQLLNYFSSYMEQRRASDLTLFCAMYFVDIDRFVDGDEQDVLRNALHDWECTINFDMARRNYSSDPSLRRLVEDNIRRAPYRIKEEFARLGCALCAAKGYISEQERKVILSWL